MLINYIISKYGDVLSAYDIIGSSYLYVRRYWDVVKVLCVSGGLGYVLDAGSGPCNQGLGLVRLCGTHLLVCLDISAELLRAGREYCLRHSNSVTEFVAGDLRMLPFRNDVFSAILSIAVLHHLTHNDLAKALRELGRTLSKSGLILMSTWTPWQLRFLPWLIITYLIKLLYFKSPVRVALVPWRVRRRYKVLRYYVLHTISEISKVLERIGFNILVKCIYTPFKRKVIKNNLIIALKE